MINLRDIQTVYFIGIGGIGMSALARYFLFHGKKVSGYDRTETALTKKLVEEGIPVIYEDDIQLAPKEVDLVVYTPAIPHDHQQLNFYQTENYTVVKRSEVLGAITASSFNICVGGTHGKTTISTMVAHILRHSGYGCNAFLGGISANYNSNFWSSENNTCVIEADEYDRSFLKLNPDVAVITAVDADHLDIYETEKNMQDAFITFASRIKKDGTLYLKQGIARQSEFMADNIRTFHLNDTTADIHVSNINMVNGNYLFDVKINDELIGEVALNMGGVHNVENASVAIAVARQLNIDVEAVKDAVEDFKGVKRRFEYIIKKKNRVYVDDYAHHPEELQTLIKSARSLFPTLKCTVIFQPHLFTRTRDLARGFAESLDNADEVILLPIYPARELPIDKVSSELIMSAMKNKNVRIADKKEVLKSIGGVEMLITAGAGDIDTLVEPLKQLLSAN